MFTRFHQDAHGAAHAMCVWPPSHAGRRARPPPADIFDGWGSYPHYLQSSQVFKQVFEAALRWFCVFQKHCAKKEKQASNGRPAMGGRQQQHHHPAPPPPPH